MAGIDDPPRQHLVISRARCTTSKDNRSGPAVSLECPATPSPAQGSCSTGCSTAAARRSSSKPPDENLAARSAPPPPSRPVKPDAFKLVHGRRGTRPRAGSVRCGGSKFAAAGNRNRRTFHRCRSGCAPFGDLDRRARLCYSLRNCGVFLTCTETADCKDVVKCPIPCSPSWRATPASAASEC